MYYVPGVWRCHPCATILAAIFKDGRENKFSFVNIPVLDTHRDTIMMYILMFSWSIKHKRNNSITLNYSAEDVILTFKTAAKMVTQIRFCPCNTHKGIIVAYNLMIQS